jgi:hypothetical protein
VPQQRRQHQVQRQQIIVALRRQQQQMVVMCSAALFVPNVVGIMACVLLLSDTQRLSQALNRLWVSVPKGCVLAAKGLRLLTQVLSHRVLVGATLSG